MTAPTILIVDDEADLLELFKYALSKLPYEILTANDGRTALNILAERTPKLIILDIAMPAPNGIDVLRHVRADMRFNGTKVLIFTAVPSRVGKSDAALADAILAKPATTKTLMQTVLDIIGG